jgi:hypothetical protein
MTVDFDAAKPAYGQPSRELLFTAGRSIASSAGVHRALGSPAKAEPDCDFDRSVTVLLRLKVLPAIEA